MRKHIVLLRRVVALSGIVALAACSAGACDPSKADFFSGIGCAASNSYNTREVGLRNNLAAAQANELTQQANASRAAAEAANAHQDLAQRSEQLRALDRQLNALKARLDAARQRQGVDQSAVRSAQDQLAALRARRAQVSPQSNDSDLRSLDETTRQLDRKLDQDGLR